MKKETSIFIILLLALAGLFALIVWEHNSDSFKKEYTYQEYLASDRDRFTNFRKFVLQELRKKMALENADSNVVYFNYQFGATTSNFEGFTIRIKKFKYGGQEFNLEGELDNRFIFNTNQLTFDPDHRKLNQPDIHCEVTMPTLYTPESDHRLKDLFFLLNSEKEHRPYRTYNKEVYSITDDTTIIIRNLNIDLWLTKFEVTMETLPWKGPLDLSPEERDKYEFPKARENHNQRLEPLTFTFEIRPNLPWYERDANTFDKKPDLAVGAIFCNKIIKKPDKDRIGVLPKRPGFPMAFNIDSLVQNSDQTIWNKAVEMEVTATNIGTHWIDGEERVNYEFIMPVLSRGSWDIQIPTKIIPEYREPEKLHKRSIFNILFPKFMGNAFGRILSFFLYAVIGVIILSRFFPALIRRLFPFL